MTKLNSRGKRNLKILFSVFATLLIAVTLAFLYVYFPVVGIIASSFYVLFIVLVKRMAEKSKATFLDTYNNAVGGLLADLFFTW